MHQGMNPAEVYEDFAVRYQFRVFTADIVTRASPQRGERVLDLACGTGVVARVIAPRIAPDGAVTGLDLSPAMLAVARARAATEGVEVAWDQGDAAALPYPDGTFDLALCQQGLQFFPDRPAALRELHRVIAPGGRAVVSVWAPIERSPVLAAFSQIAEQHLGLALATVPFSLTDADEVRALLEEAGFAAVEITPVKLTVRYPDLGTVVRNGVQTMAAVVPAFAALTPEEVAAKASAIEEELAPLVQPYLDSGGLRSPQQTHIALARR